VAKKEGASKPKVTLHFELSRSGIFSLNKAEARLEELYYVEEKPLKKKPTPTPTDNDADPEEKTAEKSE
jgi:hypothetical protein